MAEDKLVYTSRFLQLLLILGGIFPQGKNRKFLENFASVFEFLMAIIASVGFFVPVMISPSLEVVCTFMTTLAAILSFTCFHWIIKFNKKNLEDFMETILRPHPLGFLDIEVEFITEKLFRTIFVKISAAFFIFFEALFLVAICAAKLVTVNFENPKHYVVSNWYVCEHSDKNSTVGKTFCFQIDNYAEYVGLNIAAILILAYFQAICVSALMFFSYIQQYVKCNTWYIRNKIKNLIKIMEGVNCNQTSFLEVRPRCKKKSHGGLVKTIRYHQQELLNSKEFGFSRSSGVDENSSLRGLVEIIRYYQNLRV